jgi:hypothetical protein
VSQSIDRKTFVQAIVLAALATRWLPASPFERPEDSRRRLVLEAIKLTDCLLTMAGPVETPPVNGRADPDAPF